MHRKSCVRSCMAGVLLYAGVCSVRAGVSEQVLEQAPKMVTCALVDAQGDVWVGSEGAGAHRYAAAQNRWTAFTRQDGLGDDFVYALAADRKGRIWAGHVNHGVSVFDGKAWKNYGVSGPSAGPLGSRVYAIGVSPANGDVWIATEAGITRYSEAGDSWSYLTRADGLPTDLFRGIAFDQRGDVYLASACEGVLIGRAADGFTKWAQVTGPAEIPRVPGGKGLPTSLTNAAVVDGRGVVYVGTPRGLAVSADQGKSWRFVRGKDREAKARGSYAGVPEGWQAAGEGLLNEDYITSLQVDARDRLWITYRKRGYQCIDPLTSESVLSVSELPEALKNLPEMTNIPQATTTLAVTQGGQALVGRYGSGVWRLEGEITTLPPFVAKGAAVTGALPSPAKAAGARVLEKYMAAMAQLQPTKEPVFWGEDWSTEGDWVGRYGRQLLSMSGQGLGTHRSAAGDAYRQEIITGPHFPDAVVYTYTSTNNAGERRVPYNPIIGRRAVGEYNDGSFNDTSYGEMLEGPDLWVRTVVPAGVHRLTAYFMNFDGQVKKNAFRDFVLELRHAPQDENVEGDVARSLTRDERFALEKLPVKARTRVTQFWNGVYVSFLVREKGTYWITIRRNHSHVAKLNGFFIDRRDLPPDQQEGAFLWRAKNDPPAVDPEQANRSPAGRMVYGLLGEIGGKWNAAGIEALAYRAGLEAYRTAEAEEGDPKLLEMCRWKLNLWNQDDRNQFDARMAEGARELGR